MTDLYRIRVLKRSPKTRSFTVRVLIDYLDYDVIPTDPSFFLRLLWNELSSEERVAAPLGQAVTAAQIQDEAWVDANTHRFIERMTQTDLCNSPPPKKLVTGEDYPESELPQGEYAVVLTDWKWLAHVTSDRWKTTAYQTHALMPAGRETLLARPAAPKPAAPKKPAASRKPAPKKAKPAPKTKPAAPKKKPAARKK